MNKKLLCILCFFTILIVGCKGTDRRFKNIESNHQIKKNISKNKKKKSYTPEQWLAESSTKGNLWLSAYKGQYDIILKNKNPQGIANKTSYHLLKNARQLLKNWSKNNELRFDTTKIAMDYPAFEKINSDEDSLQYIAFQSEASVAQVIAAFQYVQALSPEIEILDEIGDKFADSYIDLYDSMSEFVNYLYRYKAYRIDAFKLSEPLFDKMRNAYLTHEALQKQVFDVYTQFYQQVHEQEKVLMKEAGLNIRYNIINVMDNTASTLNLFDSLEIDGDQLKAALDRLALSITNFELTLTSKSDLRKEFPLAEDKAMALFYLENTQKLASDVNMLLGYLENGQEAKFLKNLAQIEVDFQKVIGIYNHLMAL